MRVVKIDNLEIGNDKKLVLIGGPDSLDEEGNALSLAKKIKRVCEKYNIGYIFKASFDKANRLSIESFRGVGLEKGIRLLSQIKRETSVPVTTDFHEPWQAEKLAEVVDLLQVPALLSRQTDMVIAAAKTGRAVNIKKGQFLAPQDVKKIVKKAESTGNKNVIVTERGTIFGYNNLVVDMRSLEIIKRFGVPVIFDASHSVQRPGAAGRQSSGEPEFISVLARAAVGVGIAGIFLEMYETPDKCLVDCDNSLPFKKLAGLLASLVKIDTAVKDERTLV